MKKILAAAFLPIVLLLGACGSDDNPTVEGPRSANGGAGAATGNNDADVRFAQNMIAHHEQAIEMAEVVLERGQNEKVRALAGRIKAAQTPEIETMRGWLGDWGAKEAMGGAGGMDMGGGAAMMTKDEMANLSGAVGADLDRMFLEMMTRHHESAITMAKTEVEDGKFPAAVDLAKKIITDQQAEVSEMKSLLEEIGG